MPEVDTFIMEQPALVDKQTLMKVYQTAVNDQPFSSLFVKLRESDVNKVFMVRFENEIHIN